VQGDHGFLVAGPAGLRERNSDGAHSNSLA
jgi:hypothetical protein